MSNSLHQKKGLPAVGGENSRVLILGSLPGDASLKAQQYYAHPQNHFWALVSEVIRRDLTVMIYQERIEAIQDAGIALWDVIDEANRPGSLDQKISGARMNDICTFASQLPQLRAVAFNGKKAATLAQNAFKPLSIDIHHLPSSSAAHAVAMPMKSARWMVLSRYLEPLRNE